MIITPLFIIFLAVVFILLFLFLNTIDKRKWLTLSIALVATPLAYFYMFYPFLNIFSSYHHKKYFSAENWNNNPELRYEMAAHIKQSDTLIQMSKTQVSNLLGKAEWLSWDDAKKTHNKNSWNYGLGITPGAFNTKKECLQLSFKNNKVTRVKQYQDTISYDKNN